MMGTQPAGVARQLSGVGYEGSSMIVACLGLFFRLDKVIECVVVAAARYMIMCGAVCVAFGLDGCGCGLAGWVGVVRCICWLQLFEMEGRHIDFTGRYGVNGSACMQQYLG